MGILLSGINRQNEYVDTAMGLNPPALIGLRAGAFSAVSAPVCDPIAANPAATVVLIKSRRSIPKLLISDVPLVSPPNNSFYFRLVKRITWPKHPCFGFYIYFYRSRCSVSSEAGSFIYAAPHSHQSAPVPASVSSSPQRKRRDFIIRFPQGASDGISPLKSQISNPFPRPPLYPVWRGPVYPAPFEISNPQM